MLTSIAASSARGSEHDARAFTNIAIKPLLEFITKECIASMPSSCLNIVEFVTQLLAANKEQLGRLCHTGSFGSASARPRIHHASSISEESSSLFKSSNISGADAAALSSDNSTVAGSELDALKAQIRELELQLARASLAVNNTAGDLQSCDFRFRKLFDAAVSSLERENKQFMGAVFDRHAKPVGLSAGALATALHAIHPSSFSADVSNDDANKKLLREFDSSNKGHCNFEDFCKACKLPNVEDEAPAARDVFLRLADVKGLTAEALMHALKEVDAPVLSCSEGRSPEQIFRRADANLSGSIDLAEFMRAAALPDDLEMILEDHRLSVFAPAIRAHLSVGDDQVKRFAKLQTADLFAAVDASSESIKQRLKMMHSSVKTATEARSQLEEDADKDPTNKKFSTFKGAGGSIDDFFNGLEDRIGAPNLDFKKAMRAEHTTRDGSTFTFTTGNYKITTQPKREWMYVVGDESGLKEECPDMGHGRRITPIDELLKKPLAVKAKLAEEEVIAVVLYTGPMFAIYNAILRRFPKDTYDVYAKADNKFSTTIFVLVSAVQKLSRCMNIPVGTLLYRGLGGNMELPDTFFVPSEFCVPSRVCMTPNALGYTEFGFMSTTQERSVAVQYSGVRDNKPKASIMEIHPNSVDRGADISDFSQYPSEKEFLIVPYSFVQGDGRQRTEITDGGGVLTVISVNVNINLKTETLEQLKGKKKSMHLTAYKSLINETELWLHAFAEEDGRGLKRAATDKEYGKHSRDISCLISISIKQMQEIKDAHFELPDDDFVNDFKYKALVTRMLSSQAWAKEKLMLWLENQEVSIRSVVSAPLQSAHRQWLAFLKQRQHSVAGAGSEERKTAAIKILKCKGLMVSDNVSSEEADGEPLIYAAAADGWAMDDLQFLIDAGASPAATNTRRDSALHAAAGNGDRLSVETLVTAGANVNQLGERGRTPIHLAAQSGHLSTVAYLLSQGADVNAQDGDGQAPIHGAARGGHLPTVEYLVSQGADVNVQDGDGQAPIHWAASGGHLPTVEYLVSQGADVNAQDGLRRAPMHLASEERHLPTVEYLVSQGADVNAQDGDGQAPIHWAARGGHLPTVEYLVSQGADVNAQDGRGRTPIHLAAQSGHLSTVAYLLSQGADVNAQDGYGQASIHGAASGGHLPTVEYLVSHGADVNAQDGRGRTPIHWAAQERHLSTVAYLLSQGADVNAQDGERQAPIHKAAEAGHIPTLECLLSQGADVNAQDGYGQASIHLAAGERHLPTVEYLVSQGADVNVQDGRGRAPIHMTTDPRIVAVLKAAGSQ